MWVFTVIGIITTLDFISPRFLIWLSHKRIKNFLVPALCPTVMMTFAGVLIYLLAQEFRTRLLQFWSTDHIIPLLSTSGVLVVTAITARVINKSYRSVKQKKISHSQYKSTCFFYLSQCFCARILFSGISACWLLLLIDSYFPFNSDQLFVSTIYTAVLWLLILFTCYHAYQKKTRLEIMADLYKDKDFLKKLNTYKEDGYFQLTTADLLSDRFSLHTDFGIYTVIGGKDFKSKQSSQPLYAAITPAALKLYDEFAELEK